MIPNLRICKRPLSFPLVTLKIPCSGIVGICVGSHNDFYRGFLIKVTVNVGLLLCFPNFTSEILTDFVDVSIIDHVNLRL